MPDARIGALLRRATRPGSRAEPTATDATLLGRLARSRDEAAFAELVSRHGPAVWALCRRLTRTEPDAEDVFQATFLVLARDPKRVRKAASVGSWLYGVASRIGRKARAKIRTPDPDRLRTPTSPPDPTTDLSWNEVRTALDEELARLPDVLRAPILLCYFEGTTQDEAATALGWSARTVKSRVARARDLLRTRLTRRGIELPAVLAIPLLSAGVSAAVPARLVTSLTVALGHSPGAEVSPAVVALARTESPAMLSLRSVLLVITAASLVAAGALASRSTHTSAPEQVATAPAAQPAFPPGAVQIGSAQFRHVGWHSRVFFADNGNTLIIIGEGGPLIRFWDVDTGKQLHEMTLKGSHDDAAFAPEANLLAIAGWHFPKGEANDSEHVLWLIDTAERKLLRTIPMPPRSGGNRQKVRISADGKRVVVEQEGDVSIIDGKTGDELMRHKGRINAGTLAMSRDGKLVAFGSYEAYLWNWETGEEPKKFASVGSYGTELMEFAPDGKTLYIATPSQQFAAWDVATGRQIGTHPLGSQTYNVAFSPDGKTLAIPSSKYATTTPAGGHTINLIDPTTWKEVGRLPVGRIGVSHLSWSKDGTRLAAVTDYRAWIWDVKTGLLLGPDSPSHEGLITGFAFSPDGRVVYTSSDDHTIRSWDATSGKPGLELPHDYWVRDLALSPDGSLVVGSSLRNDLHVWDTKTGKERFRLLGNGSQGGKRVVRFTPDGKRFIAWGDDQFLRIFDTRTGKLLAEHSTRVGGHPDDWDDPFGSARFEIMSLGGADISADGSTFAIGSYDKSVRVIDVASGKERMTFESLANGVESVALSPDGKRIVLGGRGKSIETRLPSGRTRSTSANEHAVAVWDLATKKAIWETTSPGSWVRDLRFSPDGTRVGEMVADDEKKSYVRFWDATTGKELGRVELPSRGVRFGFDRTGKRIGVAFHDTTAAIYDLETAMKK